jgi:phytoene dehydrogenase-like protein
MNPIRGEHVSVDGESPGANYDIIVIGAGVGGLTAGALLARAGKRVLVVEAESRSGGFARSLIENDCRFDPAVHLILGCAAASPLGAGIIDQVLCHLGVRERCEFVRVEPFYRAHFPNIALDVPSGREAYVEAHGELFPSEIDGLARLMAVCARVYEEGNRFPIAPRLVDKLALPWRYPTLFRHVKATAEQVVDRYLSDPELKALVFALTPYMALPPSRMSFLTWAGMMAGYIEGGAYCCQGGFQQLADTLVDALHDSGGELIANARVMRIRADRGGVSGVVLENGQMLAAPVVVSNIDARETFKSLLEPALLPKKFLGRLGQLEPSISTLGLYLQTDLDVRALGVPQETVIHLNADAGQVYYDALAGRMTGLTVTIPTLSDPSLAPGGQHLVSLMGLVSGDEHGMSSDQLHRYATALLDKAEAMLPGLREHITLVAGRQDNTAFPLLRLGPIYGWAATPEQSGPFRMSDTTPVPGLYLVGHWTKPAHGISSVFNSGVRVARLILGQNIAKGVMPIQI